MTAIDPHEEEEESSPSPASPPPPPMSRMTSFNGIESLPYDAGKSLNGAASFGAMSLADMEKDCDGDGSSDAEEIEVSSVRHSVLAVPVLPSAPSPVPPPHAHTADMV